MACNCLYYHAVTSSMTILVVPGHSADHVLFKPVLTRHECAMSTQWVYFLSSCDSSPHMQLVKAKVMYACSDPPMPICHALGYVISANGVCLHLLVPPLAQCCFLGAFCLNISLVSSPCHLLVRNGSGEQSQISWGLFQKVIRTNEMAIMCQSFTTVNLYSSICTFFE